VLLILRPLATSRTKGYQGQSPWLVGPSWHGALSSRGIDAL
jgi:hypothetical protein